MARIRSGPRGGLLPSERRAAAEAAAAAARALAPGSEAATDVDGLADHASHRLKSMAAEMAADPEPVELASGTARSAVDAVPVRSDVSAPPADVTVPIAASGSALAPEPVSTTAASVFPANVSALPSADRRDSLRMLEALLFAASEPLDEATLARQTKAGPEVRALLVELQGFYASRGVNLIRVAGKWAFRTAEDLAYLLERHTTEERRLSKAALETLSIIAYHQPVTRAEIEDIRGVQTSKGTLDVLMETGWIRPRGRRRAPGKPITYGTTDQFLVHFGLDSVKDLPGLAELRGSGLLDGNLPPDFKVPDPIMTASLMPDELPLEDTDGAAPELPLEDEPAEEVSGDDPADGAADA